MAGGLGGGSGAGGFPTLLYNCGGTLCVISMLLAGYLIKLEFSSELIFIPEYESKDDDLIRIFLVDGCGTGFVFSTWENIENTLATSSERVICVLI